MGKIFRNYYEVLNVGRNATATDVRSAYLELATKYFPLFNPNNPTAAENYAKIQEAYSHLSDPKRRAQHDKYLDNPTSIDSLFSVRLDEFPEFIPTEAAVFRHYSKKNSNVSIYLGAGTTLSGLILTYLVTGKLPGSYSDFGTISSVFAGLTAAGAYQVGKTAYDIKNFYRKVQGKNGRIGERLRNALSKRFKNRPLEELINSLPVISHPEGPEAEAIVMPLKAIDGVLHVQYMHKGKLVEMPVSFSYEFEGRQTFSFDQDYGRVSPSSSKLVVPLDKLRDEILLKPTKHYPTTTVAHALGIKKDGKLPLLFLYRTDSGDLIFLTAEPEVNYLEYHDQNTYQVIKKAVGSHLSPKTKG